MALTAASKNALGMPLAGFGTYQMSSEQAELAVAEALKIGFRHIDTAQAYGNEEGTGRGIKASGVPRKEIFVTTKLFPGYSAWGMPEKSYDDTIAALKAQLTLLQLDYVDLYLIHAPLASTRIEQWKALVELKKLGLAKHIGVSNYNEKHLQEIADAGLPAPDANQIEMNPICAQKEMTRVMAEKGVVPIAYSSLATLSTWRSDEGQGGDASAHLKKECQEVTKKIAEGLGVSEARLLLRWGLQKGYAILTKSTKPARIAENFALFDFEISADDMKKIEAVDKNEAVAWSASGINPMGVVTPLA